MIGKDGECSGEVGREWWRDRSEVDWIEDGIGRIGVGVNRVNILSRGDER